MHQTKPPLPVQPAHHLTEETEMESDAQLETESMDTDTPDNTSHHTLCNFVDTRPKVAVPEVLINHRCVILLSLLLVLKRTAVLPRICKAIQLATSWCVYFSQAFISILIFSF